MRNPLESYRGISVLVTGHTGFKGAWLCRWLQLLGARVHGISLEFPTGFLHSRLAPGFHQSLGDIRDRPFLDEAVGGADPDLVFHLAAQPLVRESYRSPTETFDVNVRGTWNLLTSLDARARPSGIVVVTTDKVYRNSETGEPFREGDALGGIDPYSASKACAEIVVNSWRTSFWNLDGRPRLATARSGNVLGGGDRGQDRILPDALSAHSRGEALRVRNPDSRRPWLHVLETLHGYLLLGARLLESPEAATGWNFAPSPDDALTVSELLGLVASGLPGFRWESDARSHPPESGILRLDASKAGSELGWKPVFTSSERVKKTLEWERAWADAADLLCDRQIREFEEALG